MKSYNIALNTMMTVCLFANFLSGLCKNISFQIACGRFPYGTIEFSTFQRKTFEKFCYTIIF